MGMSEVRLILIIAIAVGLVISAVRKNAQRERELRAAGVSERENKVNAEDVLKSYYQMVGLDGFAISQLAPYGRVVIYGKVFEACCEECVIEKGDSIEVIGVNDRTLMVKKIEGEELDEEESLQEEEPDKDIRDENNE